MSWAIAAAIPLIAFISYAILLLLIGRQGFRTRSSRFFALYLLSMLVWSLGALMMYVDPRRVVAWNKVMLSGAVVMPAAFYGFVLAFLQKKIRRWWVYLGIGLVLALLILNALGYLTEYVRFDAAGLMHYQFGPAVSLYAILFASYLGLAAFNLVQAYQRTKQVMERNRLGYALLGMVMVVMGSLTNILPSLGAYPLDIAGNVISALLLAYAISRYRLQDISLVIRQGLYYLVPAAVVGAGYFLIALLAVNVLRMVTTQYQLLILAALVAAVTAAVFHFLREQVQAWIDRLLFRERYDAGLMLQEISRATASVLDQRELTDLILEELTSRMRISRAAFFLRHEESGQFRLTAQRGLEQETRMRLRSGHPLLDALSHHDGVLTREDLEVLPAARGVWAAEWQDLDRIGSELFVPLLVPQGLTGILVLGPKRSRVPYSLDEQRALSTLAHQMAVAIEKARLFSVEQRKARESTALLEIARSIGTTQDLPGLLKSIARRTAEVSEAERCTILLLEEQGTRLVPLMSQYADGREDRQLWQVFKEHTYLDTSAPGPIARRVVRDQRALVLEQETLALLPPSWVEPFGIQVALAVPLISQRKVIGVMILDHTSAARRFSDEQINLATTIAGQAAVALENARLWQQTIEEKERTQTIVEQAIAGIIVVDSSFRIVISNPAAATVLGQTAAELRGRLLSEVCCVEVLAEGSEVRAALDRGERTSGMEVTIRNQEGTRLDLLIGIAPLPDGYLIGFADITRLKDVDRLKSNIVANVSHELRTPLASIKAYTELLLNNLDGGDVSLRRRFLDVINQESDRLANLINDLLDLSRLESGEVEAHKVPLSMGGVVHTAAAQLEFQARERHVTLQLDVQPDLPSLMANSSLLTSLVKNLLSNAIKFSHDGGHVQLAARAEGDNIILQVSDEGIGIAADELPHLFEKFYRSWSAESAGIRGTGLGLVLSKQAAETHGGTITVESEEGLGTRFTVTLPIDAQN